MPDPTSEKSPSAWMVGCKSLLLTALIALAVLWAIPDIVVRWQRRVELLSLFLPEHRIAGVAIAAVGSLLVLWTIVVLAAQAQTTALRFDPPRRLVITGPYAWMRNPMIAGAAVQGLGVAVFTGSILVLGFFVLLGLLWNLWLRPSEEDQLQRLFGRDFELYRRSVRCWIPHRSSWTPPALTAPISLTEVRLAPGRRRTRL